MTFLLFLLLFSFFPSTTLADLLSYYCDDQRGGTYTANSPFESNLNHLLSSLSLISTNTTFNTSTHGSTPDIAYGLFLCREDVGPTDCHACIQTATKNAPSLCPYNQEVTVWYDACQLHYSANSFFGSSDNWWSDHYLNGPDASDPDTFGESEKELMSNITNWAVNNSSDLFAAGQLVYRDEKGQGKIYGMVECTRDITTDTCALCLLQMLKEYWSRREAQMYRGVVAKSCNFKYDVKNFFHGKRETYRFD